MAAHSELSAWLMPATARKEWLRLSVLLEALDDSQVPCRVLRGADWWPDAKQADSEPARAAIDACRRCPAAEACLDYALAADERFGIWGATLPEERRRSMR